MMPEKRIAKSLLVAMLLCATAGFGTTSALAQVSSEKEACDNYPPDTAPKIKVIRKNRWKITKSILVVFVSIPSNVTRNGLLAASCELGRKYASETNLSVWILKGDRAARKFNPQGEGNNDETARAFVGLYGFSRDPGEAFGQALEWRPDPENFGRIVHTSLGDPPALPAQPTK